MDELKSAREQQKRRDERADGSVPLKLSGKIHKQPESIARSRTRILWQMSSTRLGVKDCRAPVTNSAAYTTNVSGSYL